MFNTELVKELENTIQELRFKIKDKESFIQFLEN